MDEKTLRLYVITDGRDVPDDVLLRDAEDAIEGGATCLQLRDKGLPGERVRRRALLLREMCHRRGAVLILNDYAEISFGCADGVHLGAGDMSVSEARAKAPEGFIIGATAKSVPAAREAEREGASYIGVGAVFPSPSKPDAVRITTKELKDIASSVNVPAVAIGGIDSRNIASLKGCGIAGVAVIGAVFRKGDKRAAAAEMRKAADRICGGENGRS